VKDVFSTVINKNIKSFDMQDLMGNKHYSHSSHQSGTPTFCDQDFLDIGNYQFYDLTQNNQQQISKGS